MLTTLSGIPWRNKNARNPASSTRKIKQKNSKLLFSWLRNSFLLGIPTRFSVCSLNMKINILNISLFFSFCVSSPYLKLSESIILPTSERAVRKQELKQYLDSVFVCMMKSLSVQSSEATS